MTPSCLREKLIKVRCTYPGAPQCQNFHRKVLIMTGRWVGILWCLSDTHICDLSLLAIGAKDKLPEWANKMKEVISGCCPARYSKYKHGQAPLPLSDLYFLHSISPRPAMTIQRANSCDKYLVNFQRLCQWKGKENKINLIIPTENQFWAKSRTKSKHSAPPV